MKSALVTGGTGFIGYNLTEHLLRAGWQVYVTGRTGEQEPRCSCLGYDFAQIRWDDLKHPIDVVFHQAAITDPTFEDEAKIFQTNVWDSLKLFEQAYRHGVRQIVYASSCAVYGNVEPP